MGNPLHQNTIKGTLGELFVQMRLFEFGVQAAPPLKDSGNDLIAIRGKITKFIQVKTENRQRNLPEIYHLLAYVEFYKNSDGKILYDKSKIWITKKNEPSRNRRELSQKVIDKIWK